jgi:hypothetical protein
VPPFFQNSPPFSPVAAPAWRDTRRGPLNNAKLKGLGAGKGQGCGGNFVFLLPPNIARSVFIISKVDNHETDTETTHVAHAISAVRCCTTGGGAAVATGVER